MSVKLTLVLGSADTVNALLHDLLVGDLLTSGLDLDGLTFLLAVLNIAFLKSSVGVEVSLSPDTVSLSVLNIKLDSSS